MEEKMVTCQVCGEKVSHNNDESFELKVAWGKSLVVQCGNCNYVTPLSEHSFKAFDNLHDFRQAPEGVSISRKTVDERVATGDLRESLVQKYFMQHYVKYGFEAIEGPFSSGPDCQVRTKGKKCFEELEIERTWQNYLKHQHHLSKRFANVRHLVLLTADVPPEKYISKLPRNILYLDSNHFREWVTTHMAAERLNSLLKLFKGVFESFFEPYCDRSDSEMAICPRCECCAYQPDPYPFHSIAKAFLETAPYDFASEDFSLTDVSPSSMFNHYQEYLR